MRLLALLLLGLCTPAFAADWKIVPDASEIEFRVGYIGAGHIDIRFEEFGGTITFDPKRPEDTKADITIEAASLETGLGLVNSLVRSRAFLSTKRHPHITFSLKRLKLTGKTTAQITGDVTVHDVTKPLTLNAKLVKFTGERGGDTVFQMRGSIDRTAFGIDKDTDKITSILPIKIMLTMRNR